MKLKKSTVHTCTNLEFGFDCVCQWEVDHPGNINYSCEYCGLYTAGEPRCNKCEKEDSP